MIEIPKIFSYTQLRVFETCPYQYRFTHLLKIRVPGGLRSAMGRPCMPHCKSFSTD